MHKELQGARQQIAELKEKLSEGNSFSVQAEKDSSDRISLAVEKERRSGEVRLASVQSELNQRISYFREELQKQENINARLTVRIPEAPAPFKKF